MIRIAPLLVLAVAGCSRNGAGLDQMDQTGLFQYGMERLAEGEWSDAIQAFERFTLTFPADERTEEARYRLGEAHQGNEEWVTAALEFNRLATDFPVGTWADDARFQVCRSYYELSPPPPRDQEYTQTAIDHCRSLLAFHPESEFIAPAEELIQTLTSRLAEKDYDNAEYYFRRQAYHSANVYYEWVIDNYPQTPWAPRALLRLHQSYTRLGYDEEAEAAKQRLLREFPTSPQAQQVNGVTAATRP